MSGFAAWQRARRTKSGRLLVLLWFTGVSYAGIGDTPMFAAEVLVPMALPETAYYFSFISLYSTCFLALGSNFMNSSFSGVVRLFLLVV